MDISCHCKVNPEGRSLHNDNYRIPQPNTDANDAAGEIPTMTENQIIAKILKQPVFEKKPPVLLDIGASGTIHSKWKKIAQYSICIAFDADDRDFGHTMVETKDYRSLVTYNAIVTDKKKKKLNFYLTQSPHCSSSLEPDNEQLAQWDFSELFRVVKKVELNATTTAQALAGKSIDYIDWFKTDSQGCDLRLFQNLGASIMQKVSIAEFEPGIIDAYKGEDKFLKILEYFDKRDFLMLELEVRGTRWANAAVKEYLHRHNLTLSNSIPALPCWVGVSYLNKHQSRATIRELLFGVVVCIIHKQYPLAINLALAGQAIGTDTIFADVLEYCRVELRKMGYVQKTRTPLEFGKRIIRKLKKIF